MPFAAAWAAEAVFWGGSAACSRAGFGFRARLSSGMARVGRRSLHGAAWDADREEKLQDELPCTAGSAGLREGNGPEDSHGNGIPGDEGAEDERAWEGHGDISL